MRRVSNSELTTFKRCRRKWYLGHWRRLQPRVRGVVGPRELGTKIHEVLAYYYADADEDTGALVRPLPEEVLARYDAQLGEDLARVQAQAEALGLESNPSGEDEVRKQQDLGRAMLEGYFEWLEETGVDSDLEIIGSEREVSVPLVGYDGPRPVLLVGKLDVAIRLISSGARRFMDHKSVATMGDLPGLADIDEQFLTYSLLDFLEHLARGDDPTRAADAFVDGGMFNMLRKVKRTKAATPPFYGRHEVRHSVEELRSFWMRIVGEMRDVQRVEDELGAGVDHRFVAYPNPRRECAYDCDFRRLCPMLDNPREDAEAFIAEAYVEHDPYERYLTKETHDAA